MHTNIGRKSFAALYSTLLLALVYFLLEFSSEDPGVFFIVVMIYAGIGNVIYGIPISFLSDYLTKRAGKYRFILASFIHLLFACLTSLIIGELGPFAVICSLFFLLFDEWQKRRVIEQPLKRKQAILNGLVIAALFSISLVGSMQLINVNEKKTHDYYVIPEGYIGEISVLHNIEHAPQPQKIDGYTVIEINEKGYGITPLPESEGIIENKYFYINKQGKKNEIDESCVNIGPTESTSGDGYEYTRSLFTVTNENCGDDFMIEGDPTLPPGLSLEEILLEEKLAEYKDYMIVPKVQHDD
ncbi:DUF6843 domain-containing protein [Metabacillus sediminilitoris]|uniref:DUF6843 domain-containing protein n=1 Tax=Metabacillus sediminilitoris TaxID=2567941 RepID=A0A4V3WFS5_9BACI|nr:hypothetical protein [Metabacillus sediminilitoris]QGQ48192.1 hypothetical protein GMB29_24775 [Metabacillus sediminilitoris]THF81447.1 hypothetical protein E6W99_05935 [Metabacillus sediminilitoris]